MSKFKYTAIDINTSGVSTGSIEATTASEAQASLSAEGFRVIKIAGGDSILERIDFRRGTIKTRDKIIFTRQLATLINAGMPLTQSLRLVSEQNNSEALTKVISEVTKSVEGGESFGDALEKNSDVFSSVFVNMVRAGEASGTLDETLERLASQQEKDAEVLSKIRGALVYPGIVLGVVFMVIVFMLVVVLPKVQKLYEDLASGLSLPLPTKVLLSLSSATSRYWFVFLILGIVIFYLARRYLKTPGGVKIGDLFKLRVPLFGSLFTKMYMARFSRTMQTLLASGVPMLEALDITADAINNVHLARDINAAGEQVQGGRSLSSSLEPGNYFTRLVSDMINIGEQSGDIDGLLGKVADYYESELDNDVKALSTVIEPLLMVILAGVVGILIAAILMPIYGLINGNLGV